MTLTLIRRPVAEELRSCRIDMYGIVPDRVLGLDLESIGQLRIGVDGQEALLRDHFEIEDGSRDALLLKGELRCADRVGGGMQLGKLSVESDVGLCLAENMRFGELVVHGSVNDFACSQLRGGRVRITGNVGDFCGAAGPGLRSGMRGGLCVVHGHAGRFLGQRMRRGTLVAHRDVGAGCACSMIAGSIILAGRVAEPMAVAMRRGTLVLLETTQPQLPLGFTPMEPVGLSFLPLLLSQVKPELGDKCPDKESPGSWYRCMGDRASGGMGEVLWFRPNGDELLQ